MAEAPAAPHRTTGSTLLHPLSALLGIPLDQVSRAEPGEGSASAALRLARRAARRLRGAGRALGFLCFAVGRRVFVAVPRRVAAAGDAAARGES